MTWAAISSGQGPPSTAAPGQCPVNSGSAIAELGCEVNRQLGAIPKGTLVVGAPLFTDATPKDSAGLSQRVTQVLAGRLKAEASQQLASLPQARGLASDRGWLLFVQPKLERGKLSVVVQLHSVLRSFWDRVRAGNPGPSRHAFAQRESDAEVRSFMPPVPLVAKRIERVKTGEPNPVAVACGDADGRGDQEIVLVGRHRIRIGRIRAGKLTQHRTLQWSKLSVLSRSPLRQPIGGAVIRSAGLFDVGVSDRLDAVRIDGSGRIVRRLGRNIPWGGGGCAHVTGISVRPQIKKCHASDREPGAARAPRPADAVAGALIASKNGEVRVVRAARRANEDVVDLFDSQARSAQAAGVGAQLAVADLDGDGQPELLGSANTMTPAADALVVRTWQRDGTLKVRFRVGIPSGVSAIGVCGAETSTSMRPIVVATTGGAWILR